MGTGLIDRKGASAVRPIVAFDFDGTLTCSDSFRDFIAWRAGPARYVKGLLHIAPALIAYLRRRDRTALKTTMVGEFLAGADRAELAAEAVLHAEERSRLLLRPDALACWRRWQAINARLVIVTATPEFIVDPFARGLGAWKLIGTRLAFDEAGRATGALDGPNCRGAEKLRRIREALGDDVRLEAAYGDSDGDEEMLSIAEEKGMKIFGLRP
ncbi:MAG: HAD-IB family hydrolase [Caulobacteraceae bacterium]